MYTYIMVEKRLMGRRRPQSYQHSFPNLRSTLYYIRSFNSLVHHNILMNRKQFQLVHFHKNEVRTLNSPQNREVCYQDHDFLYAPNFHFIPTVDSIFYTFSNKSLSLHHNQERNFRNYENFDRYPQYAASLRLYIGYNKKGMLIFAPHDPFVNGRNH